MTGKEKLWRRCIGLIALPMAHPSALAGRLKSILQPKRRQEMVTRKTYYIGIFAALVVMVSLAAVRPVARADGAPWADLSSPRAEASVKYVPYNFTWGKVPGDPDKAVAQLHQIFQWSQIYRRRHGGAYPVTDADFEQDIMNHAPAYGVGSNGLDVVHRLENPDVRFAEHSLSGTNVIPFIMFAPRLDGQPLGGSKTSGTRDVLASTSMYVLTNWRHGIPTGKAGFYLVLWDDGTVQRVAPSQALIVPIFDLARKTVTRALVKRLERHGKVGFTYGFPGEAGLPRNTLTQAQGRSVGLFLY